VGKRDEPRTFIQDSQTQHKTWQCEHIYFDVRLSIGIG